MRLRGRMEKVEIFQKGDNGACIFLELFGKLTNSAVKAFCYLFYCPIELFGNDKMFYICTTQFVVH